MAELTVSNPGSSYTTVSDYKTGFDTDGVVPLVYSGRIVGEYEIALTAASDQLTLGQMAMFVSPVTAAGLRILRATTGATMLAGFCSKATTNYSVTSGTQIARTEICIYGPHLAIPEVGAQIAAGTIYAKPGTTAGCVGAASTVGLNIAQGLAVSGGATNGNPGWVWVQKM